MISYHTIYVIYTTVNDAATAPALLLYPSNKNKNVFVAEASHLTEPELDNAACEILWSIRRSRRETNWDTRDREHAVSARPPRVWVWVCLYMNVSLFLDSQALLVLWVCCIYILAVLLLYA